MSRWLGLILFISIFSGICLGGYYYILARLFSFFKLKQTIWFWLILLVLAFGYIVFSMLERKFPCGWCQWLLRLSAIGLGVGWLCLVVLLGHDLLYFIFRFPIQISRWVAVGAIVLLTVYSFLNAMRIEIRRLKLPIDTNLTIVQLSDIHLGSVSQRHLERLIEKTNALNPDMVLFTGDLLDPAGNLTTDSLICLNQLNAPAYWVSGNHERYVGLQKVMAILKETPVIPLRNEVTELKGIQLIGIEDSENPAQVQQVLSNLQFDSQRYTILMYHQPEGFDAAAKAGINLMLSGHTHNGQIWPFNWVVKTRFQYLRGLHRIDGMFLSVSPGSGTWGPPMRLGSRNQITLIVLKKDN
ncbi:MAG: metallophosphoesterase [Phycisphaerae bacterium]|nr:metallophosphoesterase [Phycisphaerae bacterium]